MRRPFYLARPSFFILLLILNGTNSTFYSADSANSANDLVADACESTLDTFVINACEGDNDGNRSVDIVDVYPDNAKLYEMCFLSCQTSFLVIITHSERH